VIKNDPIVRMFDRALQLRDGGSLEDAAAALEELTKTPTDQRMHALAQLQLGQVLEQLGRDREAVAKFRAAADTTPRMEAASVALFRCLEKVGEHVEALCEAFRFLTLRESVVYRELFEANAFAGEVDDAVDLVEQSRVLLDAHRAVQRRRPALMPGDTVRVRANAPASLRPGKLAVVRGRKGPYAHLVFSDGEQAEIDVALVDHHDI
jgi:hypothetical protein